MGADYYWDIFTGKIAKRGSGEPIALSRMLRWALSGAARSSESRDSVACSVQSSVIHTLKIDLTSHENIKILKPC